MRLPLGFATGDGFGVAFAIAFRLVSFPFNVAFVLSEGWTPSLELVLGLLLELDDVATFCFVVLALAFARPSGPFYCFSSSFSFSRAGINFLRFLPVETLGNGEGTRHAR